MTQAQEKIAPEALFEEIDRFITDSRTLLAAGALIELEGLDERVRLLCANVLELSQDERLRHSDRLQQLLWNLGDLGETMAQYRDAMVDEVRHLSNHQKANVAYRTVENIDGYKKTED